MTHPTRRRATRPNPGFRRGEVSAVRKLAVIGLAVLVAGCARTRTVSVTGRGEAPSGRTTITAGALGSATEIELPMDGAIYSGRVNYAVRAADASIAPGIAISRHDMRDVSGTVLAGPMEAAGTIEMSTPRGAWLHCWFSFSPRAAYGSGECGDERNRRYDLEIRSGSN
jgi:hypothetical protein